MPPPAVILEPFCREDCAMLARWLQDPELLAMTAPDWTAPLAVHDVDRAYFPVGSGMELLKITQAGRMVGHAGLRFQNATSGHLFHVIVDPCLHGRGYGMALMQELNRHAFVRHRLHRLQLFVFDDNARALACYVRAGFRIEGHHRDHIRCGERWLSTYSMALLHPDWQKENTL